MLDTAAPVAGAVFGSGSATKVSVANLHNTHHHGGQRQRGLRTDWWSSLTQAPRSHSKGILDSVRTCRTPVSSVPRTLADLGTGSPNGWARKNASAVLRLRYRR